MMSNPSLQDGSAGNPNASSQSQILLHIKKLLTETRICLDALDQSTLGGLRSDKEYKDAVGHLLAPLTNIPLSTVVNKVLTSGIEAATAQFNSLLLSFDDGVAQDGKDAMHLTSATSVPSPKVDAQPGKQRDPASSRYQGIVDQLTQWKNSSVSLSQPPRVDFGSGTSPQIPVVPRLSQISTESSPLQEIKSNRRMMATIYFVKGGKRDTVTMPYLVEEMNKNQAVIAAGGVSHAWETVRGDIVVAFRVPQTNVSRKAAEAILTHCVHMWTEDSSVYLRFGGDDPIYVLELEVVKGGSRQVSDWGTVVDEIEQEFKAMYAGPSSKWALICLAFLTGHSWSKRWLLLQGNSSDVHRLVADVWPRIYKKKVRYRSVEVETGISMNILCIADRFDFRE